jgi:hypothetical protein
VAVVPGFARKVFESCECLVSSELKTDLDNETELVKAEASSILGTPAHRVPCCVI